ncbi:exodeoxyribonuclease VII small subunit [Thioalbus denitrificans]|uniref:Exodeoxyribonuclease 7 small subunit n=1 Tax=Thioalbus denitrificans TaxID=547122 RepID=A0A369C6Q7_9GAMM|nr:exodeoxyribonuclease VII small subunit [Thioalbus denitrificans]
MTIAIDRERPGRVSFDPSHHLSNLSVARKKSTAFDFEQSLAELESLVQRMEQGDLSLEDSLAAFQRGVELTRACQQALSEAEQRVEILLARDATEPQPFDAGSEQD